MADTEKVMNGLKCCAEDVNEFGDCLSNDCPYKHKQACCSHMARDALELLKAQQPRVLTFDEVQNAPENSVVWHEINDEAIGHEYELLPFVGCGDAWFSPYFHDVGKMFTETDKQNYGKVFRCWSAKPTDAERRKAAWK